MRLLRERGPGAGAPGVLGEARGIASVLPDDGGDRDPRGDLEVAGGLLDGLGSLLADRGV